MSNENERINKVYIFIQGHSYFYILKNNEVHPKATGGTHWLEFLPDHVYCFLPSLLSDKGEVRVAEHIPEYVKDFLYCMEILQVSRSVNEQLIKP